MDCTIKNLEKTFDIKRQTIVSKLYNMQWLKNTSHSSNLEKTKAVIYKQIHYGENSKGEDKILLIKDTDAYLVEESDEYHPINTSKKYLFSDTMSESNKDMWNKDRNMVDLFLNDKLVNQKDEEEDMLSIVESIVTAKLELQFCTDKEQTDQSSLSQINATDITQNAACLNISNSQKADQNKKEQNLIKHSDGNNNHFTSYMSKINNKQKTTCKVTDKESNKISIKAKDKNVHTEKVINVPKTNIKNRNNTTSIKDNEKASISTSVSKKSIPNSVKSPNSIDKNEKVNRFNNKHSFTRNIACTKREQFVKHSISRNGIEKEIKDFTAKSSITKADFKTKSNKIPNTYQNKNVSKDKTMQKQQQTVSKQFASKEKESFEKNTSVLNHAVKKNKTFEKTEKVIHVSKNSDLSLNESKKKNEMIVGEKNYRSNQKPDRSVNLRKNITFVSQYKNSTFSKPVQTKYIPRNTQHVSINGRNSSCTYNNPKFDKEHTGNVERKIIKREYTSTNGFSKSNIRIKEPYTNDLKNHAKQQNEINHAQSNAFKYTQIDALASNNKDNINFMKSEIHLIENKESVNLNIDHIEQEQDIMREQCPKEIETIHKSKIDINQQCANNETNNEIDNEEINPSKYSSNLCSDKYIVKSQANEIHQHLLKLENIQYTDVNQLETSQTWNNCSFDNAVQKNATIVNSQQSIQNMHFSIQQTITETGNQMKQMSPWEANSNKFHNQYFSIADEMQLSQVPDTVNTASYGCNMLTSSNSDIPISALEMMHSNRENSNVPYKYTPNIQQKSVTALSNFPSHPISLDQSTRWNTSMQDGFHIEHPYNTIQPTMMRIYNSEIVGSDDFNNTHITNCLQHPVVYTASPYMQTWNPQLQYPMSVSYNSPCTSYTMIPNQSNNFNIDSMYDQQHKHIPYMQMDNYVRSTHRGLSNCTVQNTTDKMNVPIKFNQYYKRYPDNCQTVYNIPPRIIPVSKLQQDMNFMPTTSLNRCSAYCSSNQKHKQMNYIQRNPKDQMTQDICDDNGSEDTPPIISPKEFITNNVNFLNKSNQFAIFKPEFKITNMGYRPPSLSQRYSGFHRNISCQDFSKEYPSSIGIGRGTYKTRKM